MIGSQEMLSRSTFCGVVPGWGNGSCLEPSVSLLGAFPRVGVMPGWGWSGRFEDAVLHGCIPVLLQVHACLDQLHGDWRVHPPFSPRHPHRGGGIPQP